MQSNPIEYSERIQHHTVKRTLPVSYLVPIYYDLNDLNDLNEVLIIGGHGILCRGIFTLLLNVSFGVRYVIIMLLLCYYYVTIMLLL